jgi:hypothetical protein
MYTPLSSPYVLNKCNLLWLIQQRAEKLPRVRPVPFRSRGFVTNLLRIWVRYYISRTSVQIISIQIVWLWSFNTVPSKGYRFYVWLPGFVKIAFSSTRISYAQLSVYIYSFLIVQEKLKWHCSADLESSQNK